MRYGSQLILSCLCPLLLPLAASELIHKVTEYAASCPLCRGVYLHVISYNHSAILLYKKKLFKCLRRLPRFYVIGGAEYDAFVFVHYCNGGKQQSSSLL